MIGPRFDATLLRAVTTDPARLDAGLELLCDAEIIVEVAGAGSISSRCYRFTQTLLQDVIYQNLLLQRRSEMHGKIAIAFERICGDSPERLEDRPSSATTSARARCATRVRATSVQAGDRARIIFANDDALRFYEQALAALDAADLTPLRLEIGRAGSRPEWLDRSP